MRSDLTQWHVIPGVRDAVVNKLGEIKCLRTRRLKKHSNANGYRSVALAGKNRLVHRLLAEMFIPNPDDLPQINHKNGIKSDNRLSNLEWVTPQQNCKHARDTGLVVRKLTRGKANAIKALLAVGISRGELAERYGVDYQTVNDIHSGKAWA